MRQREPDPADLHLRDITQMADPALRAAYLIWLLPAILWIAQAVLVSMLISGLLHSTTDLLWSMLLAAGFLTLGLARVGLETAASARLTRFARLQVARVRDRIVRREAARAPQDPARPDSAALAALIAGKLEQIIPYVTRYRPAMTRVAVVPFVILGIAFWLSWAVGLVLLISGPLIPVFQALVGLAARDASARQMNEIGTLNTALLDRLRALADIRLLGAGARVVADFRARAETLRASTMAVLRVAFLSSAVLELFAALGVAMVAVYVGFSLLGLLDFGYWNTPLTVGEGLFLLLLAPAFFDPLRELAAAWHDKAAALAVAGELRDLDGLVHRPLPGTGGRATPLPGPASIRSTNLSQQTVAGQWLHFPDLDITPGARVAITGPSGSGKTTLLSLLAGVTAPDAGRIEVAGTPLGPDTADAWRARLAWMPQGVHFVAGSLRHNLTLARKGPMDEPALHEALRHASATEVVQRLPQGLDTRLGELGSGVSGGEARRLMLARAIHAAPDVLLADEPTADLDPESAHAVTDGLLRLSDAGVTLIVATHDLRLAQRLGTVIALTGNHKQPEVE